MYVVALFGKWLHFCLIALSGLCVVALVVVELTLFFVVIGSGIAGGTLSLCLAQSGVKVLTVEHRTHPRFVIGESTIVITTFNFNYLGKTYGIEELDGLRYTIQHHMQPQHHNNSTTTTPQHNHYSTHNTI